MANEIDVITLAIAKKYANSVGSTITAITPTDEGLHFVTSTGSFDVDISGWATFTSEEKQKLNSLNAEILNKFTEDQDGNLLYDGEQIVMTSDLTQYVKDTSYVHTDNNYTTAEKNKLAGIEEKSQKNQNAYGIVAVAGTEITSDVEVGTITFIAGEGIEITPNATNKTITVKNNGAGTNNYNDLQHKPTINDVELKDNVSLTNLGISQVGQTGDYSDLDNIPVIPTKNSDLVNDTEFITRTVNNLTNYYLSTELYTKAEIETLIGELQTLNVLVVTELPTEDISINTIYLIIIEDTNNYNQWMYINSQWANLGSTSVDLSNYYTKSQSDTNFVAKITGKGLSTEDYTTADKEKLAGFSSNENYYTKTEVNSAFVEKEAGKSLTTNDFTDALKNKLNGIEESANNYILPTASATTLGGVKLDGITITIDENGIISSSVSEVINDATTSTKETWSSDKISTSLDDKVSVVEGKSLSTNDLTNELKDNYDTAYTHSQTAHAPATAEQNVQSDWEETDTSSDSYINNKPIMPTADGKTIIADDITHMLTAQYIGENLLDNPDFAVNQRGQATYTGSAYTVDRWYKNYVGTVTVNSDRSITISDGTYFRQAFENSEKYIGKKVTASVNVGGVIYSGSGIVPDTGNAAVLISSGNVTITLQWISELLWFVVRGGVTLSWAKLEIGSAATPFVPPNPADELARCQRYCIPLSAGRYKRADYVDTSVVQFDLAFPQNLRIKPTMSGGSACVTAINSSTAIDGFTFTISSKKDNGHILINASCPSHGLTDASLYVTETIILDAEL